jgi:hypothetical protein
MSISNSKRLRRTSDVTDHLAALYRGLLAAICIGFVVLTSQVANAQVYSECGELEHGGYGPWDYTDPTHFRDKLPVVEQAHFTPEVENLQGHKKCGGDGCQLTGDIEYTLQSFPNHHRALFSMAQYHIRGMNKTGKPMVYTAECFFDRAMRFKPNDGSVYMIYGYYLSKIGRSDDALQEYEKAVRLMPNSAEAHYNLGLLYTDAGDYPRAREHAHRAYELGFPLPGLRRKLDRNGEWIAPDSVDSVAKD